jgi:hypothetical protein
MSRFQIRKRLNKTKLKAFEKAGWVAGNSSGLMQKVVQFLDIGSTTAGSAYSARTAAIDVANALKDYACSDYKCLTLDCVASCCDFAAAGIAFLPKNNVTGAAFAGCTATSKFSRTLRNRCKEIEGGLLGCKK